MLGLFAVGMMPVALFIPSTNPLAEFADTVGGKVAIAFLYVPGAVKAVVK